MKSGIHPEYVKTTVHCNGCDTTFESASTVPQITVEICSNCHPFYTGKQKLVDTAGRVDRFNARRQAAESIKAAAKPKKPRKQEAEEAAIDQIEDELEDNTVDLPKAKAKKPKSEPKTTKTDS